MAGPGPRTTAIFRLWRTFGSGDLKSSQCTDISRCILRIRVRIIVDCLPLWFVNIKKVFLSKPINISLIAQTAPNIIVIFWLVKYHLINFTAILNLICQIDPDRWLVCIVLSCCCLFVGLECKLIDEGGTHYVDRYTGLWCRLAGLLIIYIRFGVPYIQTRWVPVFSRKKMME